MNRSSIIALVIGAMLFGCGAGMVASQVLESEAVAQEDWEGQQWEHTCEQVTWDDLSYEYFMSDLGEDGWEMVNITFYLDEMKFTQAYACFKRPLH